MVVNMRKKPSVLVRILPIIIVLFVGIFIIINVFLPRNHISTVVIPKIVEHINSNAKPWFFSDTKTVRDIIMCQDKSLRTSSEFSGNYYVFYNYVKADKEFKCAESVTYSTPADFTFLDNVPNILERWRGPISIALYAPGEDFFRTLDAIAYLRVCSSGLVREFVTFHLFFDKDHVPTSKSSLLNYKYKDEFDCVRGPPWENINSTYRIRNDLLFPINLARNIAKTSAQTHFIFPSDIELYPSENFVKNFLNLVVSRPELFSEDARNVFVLPPFEVKKNFYSPKTKSVLQRLISTDAAFPFHAKICSPCHKIPKLKQWMNNTDTGNLDVFSHAKRQDDFLHWEPFFICTQKEPLWDERLFWEGQGDKMIQAFSLCLLDYDFLVLNNAFVVHRPGVKKYNTPVRQLRSSNNKVMVNISRDLQQIYGRNKKCDVMYIPPDDLEDTSDT